MALELERPEKGFERNKIEAKLKEIADNNLENLIVFSARHAIRVLPNFYSQDIISRDISKDFHPYSIWFCCFLAFNSRSAKDVVRAAEHADNLYGRIISVPQVAADVSKITYASNMRDTIAITFSLDLIYLSVDVVKKYRKYYIQEILSDLEYLKMGKDLTKFPVWSKGHPPLDFTAGLSELKNYFDSRGWSSEIRETMNIINNRFDPNLFDSLYRIYYERFEKLKFQFENKSEPRKLNQSQKINTFYQPGTQFTSEAATKQDYLNREPLAKAVSDWLMDETNKGRITIGLFGEWGLGKTSFVELLVNKLKQKRWELLKVENNKTTDKPPLHFIDTTFNAWEYEQTKNIQAGVAQEVVTGLLKGLNWYQKFWLTLRYSFRRHWFQIYRLVVMVFVLIILGLWASTKLTDGQQILLWGIDLALITKLLQSQGKKLLAHPLAKEFKTYLRLPDFGEHLGTIPVMQEQVKELIKLRLEHSHFDLHAGLFCKNKVTHQRFLFVVDDLDRCSHEGIVKTFEAIRLVMDLENVVVVIAIDQRIALASLALHYQNISQHHQADPISIARDYLGKVVHLPITLEEPQKVDVRNFLRKEWDKIGDEKGLGEGNANVRSGTNNQNGNPPIDGSDLPGNIDEPNSGAKDNPLEADVMENAGESAVIEDDEIIDDEPELKKGLSIAQEGLFIEWAQKLSITNPRRLKRLTNAYTLIRHCFPQEDQSSDIEKPYPRLVMLLWLEYVNELSPNERAVLSRIYELSDKEFLGEDRLSTSIQARLKSFREYISQEEMNVIYNQVKNFVLPAIEIVEQESEKQNYQAHKGLSW